MKIPDIINTKAIAQCLPCGHEWDVRLFEINIHCPKCGAAFDRITCFDVLEDGSKGEEYPPPPTEDVA